MTPTHHHTSDAAITAEETSLSQVQEHIQSELTALQNGELRDERQIKALFDLLPEGTAAQIATAERLQVALLAVGRPLTQLPSLGIDIESQPDGSKTISYFEVIHPSIPFSQEQLNPISKDSPLFRREVPMEVLGTVQDARLVTPRVFVLSQWANQLGAERVLDLIGDQSRLTYHNGLPITWDKNIDGKAWSTNIDTVYFSDWLRACGALNETVKVSAEVGCGAGGISQAVLANCPNLTEHVYTDIDPNAINCARRNLTPLAGDVEVSWRIGKGIHGIVAPGTLDILVTNPPYIPTPTGEGDKDHYSGTKLIKRLFEDGIALLNPNNPEAAIYVQMSSVTLPDFERYCAEHPEVEVTRICTPVRVPLRISGLLREPDVLEFVTNQGGLEVVENDPLRYYHEIMAFRLKPKRD
jgi:hypothetical protein